MRKVQCGNCKVQLELTSEILAMAATSVAVFTCGECKARQEASYVAGRATGARLWHATVESNATVETPFYLEGVAE